MALEVPQEDAVCISEVHLRSRGPDVARSQERETKAKRMRPPGLNERPATQWQERKEKSAPLLSRQPVTHGCALSGEYPARAEK